MDFATTAAFVMAYGTAHYALKDRGRLLPGQTLLVLGAAGGVGRWARVIAAASSDEKDARLPSLAIKESVEFCGIK